MSQKETVAFNRQHFNNLIFKVPEAPKKPEPEEKKPVPLPKKKEPAAPPKGMQNCLWKQPSPQKLAPLCLAFVCAMLSLTLASLACSSCLKYVSPLGIYSCYILFMILNIPKAMPKSVIRRSNYVKLLHSVFNITLKEDLWNTFYGNVYRTKHSSFTLACGFFFKTWLCVSYEETAGKQCQLEGVGRSEYHLDTDEPTVLVRLFCLKAHDGKASVGQIFYVHIPCMSWN